MCSLVFIRESPPCCNRTSPRSDQLCNHFAALKSILIALSILIDQAAIRCAPTPISPCALTSDSNRGGALPARSALSASCVESYRAGRSAFTRCIKQL